MSIISVLMGILSRHLQQINIRLYQIRISNSAFKLQRPASHLCTHPPHSLIPHPCLYVLHLSMQTVVIYSGVILSPILPPQFAFSPHAILRSLSLRLSWFQFTRVDSWVKPTATIIDDLLLGAKCVAAPLGFQVTFSICNKCFVLCFPVQYL